MQKGFRIWFESRSVRDAVIGVVSGGGVVGDEEERHLLSRRTTDFSSSIRSRIKGLGIVASLPKSSIPAVRKAIDDGVAVGDLIKMISDRSINEGRYESEMDSMSRINNLKFLVKGDPKHTKTPEGFALHLKRMGISEDEISKRVHAKFGASRFGAPPSPEETTGQMGSSN